MGSGTSSDSAAGSGDGSDAATEVDTGEEDGSDPTGIADVICCHGPTIGLTVLRKPVEGG